MLALVLNEIDGNHGLRGTAWKTDRLFVDKEGKSAVLIWNLVNLYLPWLQQRGHFPAPVRTSP